MQFLKNATIYPTRPSRTSATPASPWSAWCSNFEIEAIAVGNGTAGRETLSLLPRLKFDRLVESFMVNEAGASIYSASDIAREEFPKEDLTVRGAISIGRRLMDPW